MKTCPNCSFVFSKRRKGCCPKCNVELVVGCGKLRTIEEKQTIDELLDKLKVHIQKRDGIANPFDYADNSRERKFAFELLDRSKVFLLAQKNKISISPRDFLIGLFDYILSIAWYAQKINSLLILYNKIGDLAKEYFQSLRKQFTIQQAEIHRLQIYQENKAEICYGI